MASITIRNLDDEVKTLLRVRASANGRSMEKEVRLILADAVDKEPAPVEGLGTAIHELFKPFGGVELELPRRELMRDPPCFE
ncbi:MAG: Arc family DNA-binding protein [Bryobacterales bacterium]|nr:Arc family DNA-binding protein [Bryobacterales bacterium]